MLKKVQTQRESTPQNFTETINTLLMKLLKLSSGDQFQNTENYEVAEIEAHYIRWFSTLLPNERKPLSRLYHTHKPALLFPIFLYGF